jgi:putative tryptophan/tyrosine transport system substrate-binding protein
MQAPPGGQGVRRGEFITCVGGAVVAWPLAARAQHTKSIPRIGVLWHAGNAEEEREYLAVLTTAFNDLGYVEGKNIVLEHRFPAEQADRFRSMAQELVASKVDAIVAVTELGAKEARQASHTIPIVVVLAPDPVAAGLIESLARPGGNVTGLSLMSVDLSGKRLALLKEAVPTASRITLIFDPKDPAARRTVASAAAAAKTLGIELLPVEVVAPAAIDDAFGKVLAAGTDALFVGPGSMMFNERARIGAFVLANRLPTEVAVAEMVPFGPLLCYGPDFPDYFRRAVSYTDKILKGAKPADLPVEQPSRFKLTINLKAAKSIGLTVSPALLTTADEIIE